MDELKNLLEIDTPLLLRQKKYRDLLKKYEKLVNAEIVLTADEDTKTNFEWNTTALRDVLSNKQDSVRHLNALRYLLARSKCYYELIEVIISLCSQADDDWIQYDLSDLFVKLVHGEFIIPDDSSAEKKQDYLRASMIVRLCIEIDNEQSLSAFVQFVNNNPNEVWRWMILSSFSLRKNINSNDYIICAYETVKDNIADIKVISFVAKSFSVRGIQKGNDVWKNKAIELYESVVNELPENANVLYRLGFIKMRSKKPYITLLKKSIKINPRNSRCWSHIADYYADKDTDKAISSYEKAVYYGESAAISILLRMYMKINSTEKFENVLKQTIITFDPYFMTRNILNLAEGNGPFEDIILRTLDTNFSDIRQRKRSESGLHAFVEKIFRNTDVLKDRGYIRFHLLKLLNITLIRGSRQTSHEAKMRNTYENVCHYSKLLSLRYLVKDVKNPPKQRLYNVVYMNDPSEGEVLLELLKYELGDSNLIDHLYSLKQSDARKKIGTNNIYIGSFTTAKDKLPMWTQYGDGGAGCCYVINRDYFTAHKKGARFESSLLEQREGENILRSVVYVDLTKPHITDSYLSSISLCLQNLSAHIYKSDNVSSLVAEIIDYIRFLYKDSAYQHEEELRVIIFASQEQIKVTDVNEEYIIPKLYVEMDNELRFDEIILGPKVNNPLDIAPYLYNSGMVKAVSVSSIKYR